jgi:N-carbamoyl-L-amino-acid hydrolase
VPAPTDEKMRGYITAACIDFGYSFKLMPSGAGHDAQDLAQICPVGMIFVPSVGGISHAPREFSDPMEIEKGANVLLHALLRADRAN